MDQHSRIYVAGQNTLIGTAILRELERQGYRNVIGGQEPELTDAVAVSHFFAEAAPEYVFLAAGKSGGIDANQRYPADLMLHNLLVECHAIESAYRSGVKKLLYLASSCSYPRNSPQPMRVESLLTGPLEPTNEAYAVAKIAGIKLCQAYRQQHGARFGSAVLSDGFGPGDDFGLENSHVVAALIRKMHEARERGAASVDVWGTGRPRREFMFVDDLADGCIFVMRHYDGAQPINIGGGRDLPVSDLAAMIREVVGFVAELRFDTSRPDGMPAKLLDSGPLAAMGWRPRTPLRSAVSLTYEWFKRSRWCLGPPRPHCQAVHDPS